nr:hypothetical protein [uncultured archaeon]
MSLTNPSLILNTSYTYESIIMVTVKDIMSSHLIYGDENSTVFDIIELMARNNVGCVVIMRSGVVKGIVTERDVVRSIYKERFNILDQKAQNIMSSPVVTTEEDQTPMLAAYIMRDKNIKKLIVMDDLDVKGIITQTDIVRNMDKVLHPCG